VCQDWVDYNGHMSESAYLLAFWDSSDAFFRFFGVDEQYRASGRSLYTVETHLRHLREARMLDSRDAREGALAFADRRTPRWTGE
jgi:acyl-CoA thioesterase FadM